MLQNSRHILPKVWRGCEIRTICASRVLLSRNAPKFDDADLMSPELTSKPYKAKRLGAEYKWPEITDEQMKKDYQARAEKMMRLSAVLQGFLFLAAIGIAGTVYLKWPQLHSWWVTKDITVDDNAIEKLIHIKKKKNMAEIPIVSPEELEPDVPGLYYCGGSIVSPNKGKSGIVFPRRNKFFDNKYLKDVCLINLKGEERNLAIDDSGDLIQWSNDSYKVLLRNQNLVSVKQSNGCAYALNKSGEILIIDLNSSEDGISRNISMKRSWILPWRKYPQYTRKLAVEQCFAGKGEKSIVQFDTGKDHLVLISNVGKAYSCSTGLQNHVGSKSKGQFGIPGMSQFDEFPKCHELHEIELLNKGLDESKHVYKRNIVQVACGDYHTVARDSEGRLFVFGSNKYGQLGYPISYDTDQLAFPKPLTRFQPYFKRDHIVKCLDVQCGGQTTYVSMQGVPLANQMYPNSTAPTDVSYFSFGNGQFGELGNGRFLTSQSEPSPIKVLNESIGDARVCQWSCGENHSICKLSSGEVLVWGRNDNGQLANGKRIKQCKPQHVPQLLLPGIVQSPEEIYNSKLSLAPQQAVATGDNSTCIYWKV